jgi:hypothetical protein
MHDRSMTALVVGSNPPITTQHGRDSGSGLIKKRRYHRSFSEYGALGEGGSPNTLKTAAPR